MESTEHDRAIESEVDRKVIAYTREDGVGGELYRELERMLRESCVGYLSRLEDNGRLRALADNLLSRDNCPTPASWPARRRDVIDAAVENAVAAFLRRYIADEQDPTEPFNLRDAANESALNHFAEQYHALCEEELPN